MNNKHFFELAKDCSEQSDYSGCSRARLGCVIAYKGTVLAKGWNADRTHPFQHKYNKVRFDHNESHYFPDKVHAECMALNKIKYLDIDFSKVHIYIFRAFRGGGLALARPCPSCMAAIKELGIKHVHYTSTDGYCHEVLD